MKKDGKNLESDEYAHNLKVYLGCITSVSSLSRDDLSSVLTGLYGVSGIITQSQDDEPAHQGSDVSQPHHSFRVGMHVAAVWEDSEECNSGLNWFIGKL